MLQNEIYEEHLLNSTPHKFSYNFGGFVLRYGGIGISSNCIFPLYEKNEYLEDKVDAIEKFLNNTDFTPVYRLICQDNYTHLEKLLFNYNYDRIAESSILICHLPGKQDELFRFADFNENGIYVDYYQMNYSDFFDDYMYLKNFDNDKQNVFLDSSSYLWESLQHTASTLFLVTLIEENSLIGQAIVIRQGNLAILKDLVIHPSYRGLGYSSKLLNSILTHCLKQNIKQLITEVFLDNESAVNLFARNGMFESMYNIIYRQKIKKSKGRFVFD